MRQPIQRSPLSPAQIEELQALYRPTTEVHLRTRAHIILLAAEQGMSGPTMAQIGRDNDQTVRNWRKRDSAEGIAGLYDAPRLGAPQQGTPAYGPPLRNGVRWRPRRLGWPDALWTLARLADARAEPTGRRVEAETGRRHLHEADLVLRRPQQKTSRPAPAYQGKKGRGKRPAMA
jgi:transposase